MCKGAPEELIDVCSYVKLNNKKIKLTKENKELVKEYCMNLSSEGLRLLGFASKSITHLPHEGDELEQDLTFLGIMGIIDSSKRGSKTCY